MKMAEVTRKSIQALIDLLGADQVSVDPDRLADFSHDETEDIRVLPDVVVRPSTPEEVSLLLRWANEAGIPVTPAAARTGLSGGAIPVHGGISLSMERFNRILEIDPANFQASVEPGVVNQVFHEACKEQGLFYPPDPSSWGSSKYFHGFVPTWTACADACVHQQRPSWHNAGCAGVGA
jgi:glycolate oxidase